MIADDPYLVEFVEEFSKICKGVAYFSSLNNLGEMVLQDYSKNRKKINYNIYMNLKIFIKKINYIWEQYRHQHFFIALVKNSKNFKFYKFKFIF